MSEDDFSFNEAPDVEGWEENSKQNIKKGLSNASNKVKNSMKNMGNAMNDSLGPVKNVGTSAFNRLKDMFSFDLGPFQGLIVGLIIISLVKGLVRLSITVINKSSDEMRIATNGQNVTVAFLEQCFNFWCIILIIILVIFTINDLM